MQLISYYLGGKADLYADLQRQRGQASLRIASPCQQLDQAVAAFFEAPETSRPRARLPAWQGLSSGTGGPARRAPIGAAVCLSDLGCAAEQIGGLVCVLLGSSLSLRVMPCARAA